MFGLTHVCCEGKGLNHCFLKFVIFYFYQINDEDVVSAADMYEHCPPHTKEALYYRRIFDQYYPNHASFIQYYWMPKWTESKDPSARTLTHYKS